jgi:hypothetical protein
VNKSGAKADKEELPEMLEPINFDEEESCESCKL